MIKIHGLEHMRMVSPYHIRTCIKNLFGERKLGGIGCFSLFPPPVQGNNDNLASFIAKSLNVFCNQLLIRVGRVCKSDQSNPDPFDFNSAKRDITVF